MEQGVKIGVIGAGVFGAYHCSKVVTHPNSDLAGIYDIERDAADALAARFDAPAFDDLDEFLDGVDAVIIASPAVSHFALASETLARGRHVLVEKPLALTLREADRLMALAEANDCILQVGHQERYVCEAAGLFDAGEAPTRIECIRRGPRTGRCEDVSVVFDLMVHDLDLVRRLTGADIAGVRASGGMHEAEAELVLDSGAVVMLEASRCAAAAERRMNIQYPDREIEFDFMKRVLIDRRDHKVLADFSGEDIPQALQDPLAYGASLFINAVRGGGNGYVSGEDGRACIDWALQIQEAAGLGAAQQTGAAVERLRA